MNIEINGATLQCDFMDADFMDKFEPALDEVLRAINRSKTQKSQSVAAGYRDMNQCVENFFDAVWQDGASERIFNGSKNVMVHLEALARINDAYKEERKQFNDFSNRYTQRQNGFQPMQGHKKKQKPQGNGT